MICLIDAGNSCSLTRPIRTRRPFIRNVSREPSEDNVGDKGDLGLLTADCDCTEERPLVDKAGKDELRPFERNMSRERSESDVGDWELLGAELKADRLP